MRQRSNPTLKQTNKHEICFLLYFTENSEQWYFSFHTPLYVQVLFEKQLCKQCTIKEEKSINYFFSIFDFLESVELESLKYPREDIISVLAWKRQVFASWQITSFVASSPMDNFHGTRKNILSQMIQFLEFRLDFNLDMIEMITISYVSYVIIFTISKVCFYFR